MQTVLVAAAVTCVGCYPVLLWLQRGGRLDMPNARSSHAMPTPRGGGLALLLGIGAAAAVDLLAGPSWSTTAWVAVLASTLLALVGLTDDLVGLSAQPRLLTQIVVGAVSGGALAGWRGALLGMVVLPAAVNMVNFMDGINGICAVHAMVWGVGALIASAYAGGDTLAVLGALSLGGGLGFLPWNVPQARLFLGDVGSYLSGGLAGTGVLVALTALLPGQDRSAAWPVLGLVCGPYFLFAIDTASTLARRAAHGQPLFVAHRGHTYQQLANDLGLPHWTVSFAMAGLSTLTTLTFLAGPGPGAATAGVVGIAYLGAPRLLRAEARV